jgi:hypothetical protein
MNNAPQPRSAQPGPRHLPCHAMRGRGLPPAWGVGHAPLAVRLYLTLAGGRDFHLSISDIAWPQPASAPAALRPSRERIADGASRHTAQTRRSRRRSRITPALPTKSPEQPRIRDRVSRSLRVGSSDRPTFAAASTKAHASVALSTLSRSLFRYGLVIKGASKSTSMPAVASIPGKPDACTPL